MIQLNDVFFRTIDPQLPMLLQRRTKTNKGLELGINIIRFHVGNSNISERMEVELIRVLNELEKEIKTNE